MSKKEASHYDELGVLQTATREEIKKSYQQLVLKVHPDKNDPSLPTDEQQKRIEAYHTITNAWKILGDKEKREQYDKGIREQGLLQEWPVNAQVDLDDMELDEETGSYSWKCRCSGEYVITEEDLEQGQNVVCCSTCTLCIRVMYAVLSDQEEQDEE
ncbi:dnaJ homolog subfamily C member 24-like [Actinia tenebrosa]|uniref:DnaJ homolog subfamily C member 24-like n=1 Tax=Actinia tenebrosa TaxID=6105 RepID=A0A6P8HQL7_ACTTE|nr:dnaJ homolog subfamily C member 24-like [Actinia tenebrosa]XP_031557847.1 dnaJ homolog subfamily C member 24-like [Actinia tenebrosa]